jgi:hypothetical protein
MRLNEFYSPEDDQHSQRKPTDTRKSKLRLSELNKLRKYREIKNLEKIEHEKFARTMYAQPTQDNTAI